jgi:hypothetical protein
MGLDFDPIRTRPSSIPADLWALSRRASRAVVAAVIAGLEARIAALEGRLNRTSANSSRPPSSDPPNAIPAPARVPSGKRKGGQPEHVKPFRPALPPDEVVALRPETCRHCDRPLAGDDPTPRVHQVVEVPVVFTGPAHPRPVRRSDQPRDGLQPSTEPPPPSPRPTPASSPTWPGSRPTSTPTGPEPFTLPDGNGQRTRIVVKHSVPLRGDPILIVGQGRSYSTNTWPFIGF